MTVENSQESFHCAQCENLDDIKFSDVQRPQENVPVKLLVKNLPEGITEFGVKNLFLTAGRPLTVSLNVKSNCAIVLLGSMNEAELALRDLHCKPPYELKLILMTPMFKNSAPKKEEITNESKADELWEFSYEENVEYKVKDEIDKISEVDNQIRNAIKNLGYNPLIRMRQKKLDFRTNSECVSMGRGYMYMGKNDNFGGGLQHFKSTSANSRAKDKITFTCEICQALTTKICGKCCAPFCSKVCLRSTNVDHHRNCSDVRSYEAQQSVGFASNSGFNEQSLATVSSHLSCSEHIPLTTGCTVVISTYFTMNTVFVRCSDEPWEEKFMNLCNDVAAEAFKGGNLKEIPKEGDFVIAKYYEDLCFYRAKVRSHDKWKTILFFIDFGNVQETKLEDIKLLPDHLKSVPAFAVEVHLKGVSEASSLDSVNYFNKLTAQKTLLILKFENSTSEAVLIEKDTKVDVNETVISYSLPSFKKKDFVFSKLGEIFYLNSIKPQNFEIGSTCNLIISHFDEKEFLESEVFWVTDPETDDFFHARTEMYFRIKEYCELLKGDCYLPRVNELCLAKENGEWHRCVNLKSHKTTCCLFFIDDGHSSLIETQNIRKMIQDFTETPSQAVCCTLPDNPKLKTNKELQSKVVQHLKECYGRTINSVSVLKLMGDAYCLSIPEINKILA